MINIRINATIAGHDDMCMYALCSWRESGVESIFFSSAELPTPAGGAPFFSLSRPMGLVLIDSLSDVGFIACLRALADLFAGEGALPGTAGAAASINDSMQRISCQLADGKEAASKVADSKVPRDSKD